MDFGELLLAPARTDEERRRFSALSRLLEVTRSLAAAIDLTTVLQIIAQEVRQALDCDRASLYQYDPIHDELFTRAVTSLEINEIRHGLDEGITGYAARHRMVVNVPEPALDSRWNSSIDERTGYTTLSILAAPLLAPDGTLLGVLELINKQDGVFDAFDERLIQAFAQHASVAIDRARLVDEVRLQHSVEASLNVAKDVQRSFMPRELPAIPGYEVATWWYPHQAVGGDYCDVIPLRNGGTALVIADVSGHGLGPSLLMASVRAALRALILEHSSPSHLLNLLARSLACDLHSGRFITMVLAVLDPLRHSLEFANAGHAPADHFDARHGKFIPLEATGVPLGVDDEPDYPLGPKVRMEVGDILVLCTDGIVEATNACDQQFGRNRLEQIVAEGAQSSMVDLARRIGARVEDHYALASPPDDLTVLVVRRNA